MKDFFADLKASYFTKQIDKADVFAKAFPHFEKAVALVERERIEDGKTVTVRADTPDPLINATEREVPRRSVARKICIVDLQRFLAIHFRRTGNHGKLTTQPAPMRPEPNVARETAILKASPKWTALKIPLGPQSPLPRAYVWGPAYGMPSTLRQPLFW